MTRVDLEHLREAKCLLLRCDSDMATACALAVSSALVALQEQEALVYENARLRGHLLAREIELKQREELSRSQGWAA